MRRAGVSTYALCVHALESPAHPRYPARGITVRPAGLTLTGSPPRWSDSPFHAGVPERQRAIVVDPTPAGAPRSMLDLYLSTRHGDPHVRRDWNRPHHRLHHRAPSPPRYTVLSQQAIAWLRRTVHPPQSGPPHARTGTVDDQSSTIGRGDRCAPELPNSTAELTCTTPTPLMPAHSPRCCHAADPLRRIAGGGQGPRCRSAGDAGRRRGGGSGGARAGGATSGPGHRSGSSHHLRLVRSAQVGPAQRGRADCLRRRHPCPARRAR